MESDIPKYSILLLAFICLLEIAVPGIVYGDMPPYSAEVPYPLMLHERDVIHYVNTKREFKQVGNGSFADVTLGELRPSGVSVVFKRFRESTFYRVFKEVRVHRYMEHLGITPRLIGLLPTGPSTRNISIVYEYIENSRTIFYYLRLEHAPLRKNQWAQICFQLSVMVLLIHQQDVLFNDLHGHNGLIVRKGKLVNTHIIDFGHATYKTGRTVQFNESSLLKYSHLPPELVHKTQTTTASDVYALGYIFSMITNKSEIPELKKLSLSCMEQNPKMRPEMATVVTKTLNLLFKYSIRSKLLESCLSQLFTNITHDFSTRERCMLSESEAKIIFYCIRRPFSRDSTFPLKSKPEIVQMPTPGLNSLRCRSHLNVLNQHDFVSVETIFLKNLAYEFHYAIRLGMLETNREIVLVKEFYDFRFQEISQEACVTAFLAERGVTPPVVGLTLEYKSLRDVAMVQECFGDAVTMETFLHATQGFEWSKEQLINATVNDLALNSTNKHTCNATKLQMFKSITTNLGIFYCKAKSIRQRVLEQVCKDMVSKVQITHRSGIAINNLDLRNVLVKLTEKTEISFQDSFQINLINFGDATLIMSMRKTAARWKYSKI